MIQYGPDSKVTQMVKNTPVKDQQIYQEGEELPAWAAPAVRKVTAIMQQRGLGASSMAAAAITQAVYESAVPIAANDAKVYATVDLQHLNNDQQAALQNAATYAAMDKQNLNARLQAAVNNAPLKTWSVVLYQTCPFTGLSGFEDTTGTCVPFMSLYAVILTCCYTLCYWCCSCKFFCCVRRC